LIPFVRFRFLRVPLTLLFTCFGLATVAQAQTALPPCPPPPTGADTALWCRIWAKQNGYLKPHLLAADRAQWPGPHVLLPPDGHGLGQASGKTANSGPDCALASPICAASFPAITSFNGPGAVQELPRRATCLTFGEGHSNWFIFTIEQGGELAFTANPGPDLDFDFALYDLTGTGCDAVPRLKPLRCNYSAQPGLTGLVSPASTSNFLEHDASAPPHHARPLCAARPELCPADRQL